MQNATLVYSSKWYDRSHILSYEGSPATRLFNAILYEKFKSNSRRITFRHNRYTYTPTNEYKNYVIRFRGVTK
jgi:hypothetical protein